MKKLTALILALALCAFASAFAEAPAEVPTTDLGEVAISYAENWVELSNGMSICVPPEWTSFDVTLLSADSGILYSGTGANGESLNLVYAEAGMTDLTLLAAAFAVSYPDTTEIIKINGIDIIQYSDEAYATHVLCTLDAEGGMYMLIAMPIPAEEYEATLQIMLSTLKAPEAAAQ